jgi:pyrroloquinoline-quinone synthase
MKNQFFEEVQQRIAYFNLLNHPFYQAWSAGELTRDDLREYSAAYYHHVAAFPTHLSALHSRLPDGELRRAVLRNLCDEEIDGRAHADLWLDFAEAMGNRREDVRATKPIQQVQDLLDTFRRLVRECSPAGALAALYAYESQVPEIAKVKANGLRNRYGVDERSCRYFSLHQSADVQHSRVWREELERVLETRPELAGEAVNAAEAAAKALWNALDGVEELRQQTRCLLQP